MNEPTPFKSAGHRLATRGNNSDPSAPASARQKARLNFLDIAFRDPLTVAQAGVLIDRSNADPAYAARIEEWHACKFALHPALYPPTSPAAVVPDRPSVGAEFHLPPRGEGEPGATVFQKRRLELFGNCDLPVIDTLGREQAAALIQYLERQSVARSLERLGIRTDAPPPDAIPEPEPAALEKPVLLAKPLPPARSGVAKWLALGALVAVVGAGLFFVFGRGGGGPELVQMSPGKTAASATPAAPAPPAAIPPVANAASFKQAVDASQKRAMKKYPALAQPGSRFNGAFLARYQALSQQRSPRLSAPDWPEKVADECATQLPASAYVK